MRLLFILIHIGFTFSNQLSPNAKNVIIVYGGNGVVEVIDPQAPIPEPRASASDITLYLYTQRNPSIPEIYPLDIRALSSSSIYDSSKQNVFVIHGWQNSHFSSVNRLIRSAYVDVVDVNVFVVDWSPISHTLYTNAFANVPRIGQHLGQFIEDMQAHFGLGADKFTIVGHSLGAHVAGCTGAAANSDIGVIVGLDPAGPLYFNNITENRLHPSDAQFVHAIHTCGGRLGYDDSLGTADYRPNGGKDQPGCRIDPTGVCAHARAYKLFAESVRSGGFTAWKCDNYVNFTSGKCQHNKRSRLGGVNIDRSAVGDYYLDTNSRSLYSQS
ncbi:lipase member H-like [Agrilus planipennis]|uniref:Lipase member H-like n=1 Tax=Agrilus planipennis TaxID=224129 RepID=A0A1W4WUG6_AGRPL|nr:lipase member H-like [Agrilus planipennis]